MAILKTLNAVEFQKGFKAILAEKIQDHLENGCVIHTLEENIRIDEPAIDWVGLGDYEKRVVLRLKEQARQLGSDQGAYADGVLEMGFNNKAAAQDYMDFLDDEDDVIGYEVEASAENLLMGRVEHEEVDFDDVMFDGNFQFDVIVYLNPEFVHYEPVEVEISDEDGDGESDQAFGEGAVITEIKRRIKVNFRGRRRVKMQCSPGFKYDPAQKVCKKITGSEVAQNRKSHRLAVRTRKAKGQSFKVRTARKSRKAKRFRKSMGLSV